MDLIYQVYSAYNASILGSKFFGWLFISNPVLYVNEKMVAKYEGCLEQKRKRATDWLRNPLIFMVGGAGIEPATSTVWR